MSVHGNAGGAISRDRIIAATGVAMSEHQEIAGLVARISPHGSIGRGADYVALMKSGLRQQYASRAAIVCIPRQSPDGVVRDEDK